LPHVLYEQHKKTGEIKTMEIGNIFTEIINAPIDKGASIKITKMTGNEKLSVFAAEISPKSKLNPHFHKQGIETYQILQGNGIMKIGELKNDAINWLESINVKRGDCFTIEEKSVHQLINEEKSPLLVIFSCPAAHLADDRYFI
jgi:mannose-6-phosphate isomerase-like protein (cupin superfamily)